MFERLAGDDASVVDDRGFRVLLLASVASPLGASVVSPVLDSLTTPFGVSEARIGLLMAVFTAPAVLLIPVVGVVSDRYGRKPVLAAGLSLFGAAGVSIALTTDFTTVLALRLLQGIGYAGVAPVLIASVGDLYEGAREATAQGLRFTTVGASATVFPLLSGLLIGVAWQAPFVLYAVALVAAVVVLFVFEEPQVAADGGHDPGWSVGALVSLARRPDVAATLVGRAVPSFLWFVFLTHNSLLVVRVLGGTPGHAGAVVALGSITSSLGSTQVGRLTARFDSRRLPLLGSLAVMAAGVAVVGLAPSILIVAVASGVAGAGFGVVLTLYRSTLSAVATDDVRGGLVSTGESIGRLGSTLAPVVLGAVVATTRADLGFTSAIRLATVGPTLVAAVAGLVAVVVATRG
ncbi:MFS transporter [Salinigranum sp. GCM10025319]|uniref:MFS transporter n=1 Tax=Salinigranum sp. GCM10025319 TaxID=3252687 RepID=UPI003605D2C1